MSLLKILHTCGISHFSHMVFRLHWWAKAAVGAGRVSQWVSSDRRAPSSMQRTEAAQSCGSGPTCTLSERRTDFPSRKVEEEEAWKKQGQTNWICDVWCRKKKVFTSQTMMSSNVASASWLPQEKKGGKKRMWPQVLVVSIVRVNPTRQEVCLTLDLCPLWLPPFPDVSRCQYFYCPIVLQKTSWHLQ